MSDANTQYPPPGQTLSETERIDYALVDGRLARTGVLEAILRAVNQFTDHAALTDDRTLIGIQVHATSPV